MESLMIAISILSTLAFIFSWLSFTECKNQKLDRSEVIKIVGEALANGNENGEVGCYESIEKIILWDLKRIKREKSLQYKIICALLDHLGLEFKEEHDIIMKRKKQKSDS